MFMIGAAIVNGLLLRPRRCSWYTEGASHIFEMKLMRSSAAKENAVPNSSIAIYRGEDSSMLPSGESPHTEEDPIASTREAFVISSGANASLDLSGLSRDLIMLVAL